MKLLRQIAAGVLLSLSLLFLMVAALAPFDESEPPEERRDMVLGGLMLGVPMMLGGGWLLWGLRRDWREEESDRLRSLFFETARAYNGCFSVMQFAMAANISGNMAKQYLDERAKEFEANFEVDEQGGVFYRFPLRQFEPPQDLS
ncbi:hypothetical protein P7L53_16865 [Thermoleptolyngbya sichuanensis XZ-Cy5]|uniref:hypothetical protein n=1 Tax=Thermoleptolyngbya sichuanensis TaxID=2885951 RepID=UPI00240E6B85|nr:hypothetical protein [Thermoleptolyngbya sichuanensis]MDG2617914.1 hypothetical protein [Thermoleptolyngbya sichuanensis XZ-Cy5]